MDYLLVGNGPVSDLAEKAKNIKIAIQINDCPYARYLTHVPYHYIFLTNTGDPAPVLAEKLASKRSLMPEAKIFIARNPLFYTFKRLLVGKKFRHYYQPHQIDTLLKDTWPVETLSFSASFRLDTMLRRRGMPFPYMPSTGLIAYDWLSREIGQGSRLLIEGFTFEGWQYHPWEIERYIVKPFEVPLNWYMV